MKSVKVTIELENKRQSFSFEVLNKKNLISGDKITKSSKKSVENEIKRNFLM